MADGNAAEIVAGIRNTEEMTVTEDKTAKRAGSGDLEVFSTPDMVALMEKTCLDSVRGALGENSGTVGTLMNIKLFDAALAQNRRNARIHVLREGRVARRLGGDRLPVRHVLHKSRIVSELIEQLIQIHAATPFARPTFPMDDGALLRMQAASDAAKKNCTTVTG